MAKKITGLKPNERLVVRTQSGKFAKFKSDRKLIFEVRDKKTNKVKRYLNRKDRKTKKPIPQKFTAFQKRFLTAQRSRGLRTRQVRSVSITLNSRSYIIDQLLKKGGAIIKMARSHLRTEKQILIYGDLRPDTGGVFRSPMVVIGKSWRDDEILKAIAVEMIINPVRDQALRMSPKKYARNDKEKKRRQIKRALFTAHVAKF